MYTTQTPTAVHMEPDTILNETSIAQLLSIKPSKVRELFNAKVLKGQLTGQGGYRTTWRMLVKYVEGE